MKNPIKSLTNAVGSVIASPKTIALNKAIKGVDRDVKAIKLARGYDKATNQVPGALQARTNRGFAEMSTKARNKKWSK